MKLFTTPNSPYGRIVRVMLMETGLNDRVETVFVTVRDSRSALLAFNPSGKVPSLLTDDGAVLSETRIILEYLDALHGRPPLLAPPGDLAGRALEGMLFGCLEGASTWMREYKRPGPYQYAWLMDVEHARAARCLDAFETHDGLFGDSVRVAQLALGCTLGFMDTFLEPLDWRGGRPKLAAWYESFARRPSMQVTAPKKKEKGDIQNS